MRASDSSMTPKAASVSTPSEKMRPRFVILLALWFCCCNSDHFCFLMGRCVVFSFMSENGIMVGSEFVVIFL